MIEILIQEARDSDDKLPVEMPEIFFPLIEDIMSEVNKNDTSSNANTNKRLWVAFGQWLGLKQLGGKIKRKHVRQYLRLKWKKISHSFKIQNNKDFQAISNTAMAYNTRKEKVRLILLSRNNIQSLHESVKIHYISKPECITDANGQTLVHLENLNDPSAVMQATNAVNEYYFHTLKHPSHRSKEFWKNFVEHFGAYTLYNTLPYTSSNTASSHNIDH